MLAPTPQKLHRPAPIDVAKAAIAGRVERGFRPDSARGSIDACVASRHGMHLIHDRYATCGEDRCYDLATGEVVSRADAERGEPEPASAGPPALAPLTEVLDHGREGSPRWLVSAARNGAQAGALIRRVAAEGRARGFVPISVALYRRFRESLAADLQDRALLLLGALATPPADSSAALVDAASRSSRPHMLLTFRSAATAGAASVVREARAVYGADLARRRLSVAPLHPDVARYLGRAERAAEFVRSGRHAAAERLLRDVSAALNRRSAFVQAAVTLISLGRLLLDRGRADAAHDEFGHAIAAAERGRDAHAVLDGRLWQALARTDAGHLTEAEALVRAVLLAAHGSADHQVWARAVLARILLWRGNVDEAARLSLAGEPVRDEVVQASIDGTAVRLLLAQGLPFDAGLRACALMDATAGTTHPTTKVVAQLTHLRVLLGAGDLTGAEQVLGQVVVLARAARAPLRSARARLLWFDALRRAGRHREAQREAEYLTAVAGRTPGLLQRAIVRAMAPVERAAHSRGASAPVTRPASVIPLIAAAHEVESDRDAVARVMEWMASETMASRVDLVSADAGPVTTIVSAGSGLPTTLGARVLEAALCLPPEPHRSGIEMGVPVRFAGRLLAALVCRWPVDRQPPPNAIEIVDLAGAIVGPRVDGLLTRRREEARASVAIPGLVGISAAMTEVRRGIERAAAAPFAVLIEGESGVGKELVARAIHHLSPRRERRFCDVNCAALPDDLLEAELFGHARGAYTGAVVDRAGLFEDASEGTIFLDELPDLSPRGQAKLLRVLQQQEVRRIGETFSRKIDVRLVTATNRDMNGEVAAGRFRQDLLYRLDVIRLRIPPLRDRPEDVAVLAERFWSDAARRVGSTARLTHGVLADLSRYHWPGNVRELQNVVAALAVAAPARGRVHASLLPAAITGATAITSRRLADARTQFERRCIEVALAHAGGNRTRAAAALGLSRQGLLKTMARVGIDGGPIERPSQGS
jgi:DNA-binding NtrC family response regulator